MGFNSGFKGLSMTIVIVEIYICLQNFATNIETGSLHFLEYSISFFFLTEQKFVSQYKPPESVRSLNLIFIVPCIVIHSYSTTNKMRLLSQIIYYCKTLYMFRRVFPSIIRSSKLRMQQRYMPNSCCYLLPQQQVAAAI